MTTAKTPYTGKATSLEQQLILLEQNHILITDKEITKKHLSFLGYYRLFSYVKPFLSENSIKTSFEKIWSLYTFDRKLRLLAIDAIERIEVAFRVSISEVMSSQYDPFWYTNNTHFKHIKWHVEFMDKVIRLVDYQDHPLIKHFFHHYSSPDFPPSWMITECLTFGTWSKVFDNLKRRQDKIAIANRLNMKLYSLLSWIRCVNELRNLCAHHERVWNHFYRHVPKGGTTLPYPEHSFAQQAHILDEMLKVFSPNSDWKNKLKELMEEHQDLPLERMGFAKDWKNDAFWNN